MSTFRMYDIVFDRLKKNLSSKFVLVNICDFVTCQNNGTCRQSNTSSCFTCDCQVGFNGTLCQLKEEVKNISKKNF